MYDPARGYPTVVPYLLYEDLGQAVRWMAHVLGAREAVRFTAPDGEPGHIEVVLGHQVVMLGRKGTPFGETASITLAFVDDVDRACARAVERDGVMIAPAVDQPWGLRQAVVADPEGQRWELSAFVQPVPLEAWGARQLAPLPGRGARAQPLLSVHDVEAASRWYQHVLGVTSAHGGDEYERLERGGELILQLHRWEVDHHHGAIGDPDDRPYGNGVLVWFEVDDFDRAVARLEGLGADVLLAPHVNRDARHREIWVHDPDGYVVVLASPDGEADG